ncbi:1,2-phenylacetyl-CoA epoxidase subunit PaaC [Alicyclobacillus vulcanalis]|uniref:Ring-1,2-phenylacetyl-CoA epoxidase subunit PaaC n=1 Tax=Alicyclobacillus vulcanalis TaxID=252246 RepID=A0A1N7N813_9BACL|nr:1,2-phenylacetyl-CoA epoxidase subunit PaaC [Alicyclobacillus vulcanalis]SIS94485.1 ring-1,2-phenylacetyl-CoA epoxidase subunit PaaC [Alicyclobacillus vulcanalis]
MTPKENGDFSKRMLSALALQLGDEELFLGHRDSEWLGLAPEVEEDVAFASIAQDEVRHAAFWYELAEAQGAGQADALAFDRPASDRKHAALCGRPNGDWAHTVLRHYLYDAWDAVRLAAIAESGVEGFAQGARRMLREEHYHHVHMEKWVVDLGRAGGEAERRLRAAYEALLPDLPGLTSFAVPPQALAEMGILPRPLEALRREWMERILPVLTAAGLSHKPIAAALAADDVARIRPTAPLADAEGLLATMNGVRGLGQAVW